MYQLYSLVSKQHSKHDCESGTVACLHQLRDTSPDQLIGQDVLAHVQLLQPGKPVR